MTKLICIHCGSRRVHRSHRQGWLDRALLLAGGRTCRCHECNARFMRFGGSLLRIADVHRAVWRLLMALAMMTAAGAVLAGIVWLSHTAAFSPTESRNFVCPPQPSSAKAVRES
jgi:hypothetical protein